MKKYIAGYYRLSDDDGKAGESSSIISQRQIIEGFVASAPEFAGAFIKEFIDDGYSGTNFNRPAVTKLLEAVRRGEVACIIVKDFSRFGRQYLEVSRFIEQIFPCLGVRFIAIGDHYDSNNHNSSTADIDVPVRNLINALYSRDISKKVKSAKRTQMQKGVFSNAFAPYGYMKDKTDRHCLRIDDPAAKVVRRIFSMSCEGYSAFQIADNLNADDVLTPALYKKHSGSKLAVNKNAKTFWTNGIISRILHDERYTGTLVGGQHETIEVGSGKKRHQPKDAWIRVSGAIPAIVTPEMWNKIAVSRQAFANAKPPETGRILFKKVRCGYCGHAMKYVKKSPKPYYRCDTIRYTDQYGCNRGLYRKQPIIDAVKTALKAQLSAMLNMKQLCRDKKQDLQKQAKSAQTAAARLDAEIKQLQLIKRQLYERYKNGILDKTGFIREREAIAASIDTKAAERDALAADSGTHMGIMDAAHQFLHSFLKYQSMPELPDKAINEMAETVYVYGEDRIEIVFSFQDEWERILEVLQQRVLVV